MHQYSSLPFLWNCTFLALALAAKKNNVIEKTKVEKTKTLIDRNFKLT